MLIIFSVCAQHVIHLNLCSTFWGGVSFYKIASSFTYHVIIKIEIRSNKARQCEPILQQMHKNNAN
jgi:hypothetical protein